jgi:fatty-acyl-CoA synthase
MPIPVPDWVRFHAEGQPSKLASVDVDSGRTMTYAQFDERVTRLARALSDTFGVRKGDRVAVLATNGTDQLEVQFSAQKLGFIYLPLNWRLALPELEYICRDGTPVALIYHASMRETALELAQRTGIPSTLEMADGTACTFERAIAAASSARLPSPTTTPGR